MPHEAFLTGHEGETNDLLIKSSLSVHTNRKVDIDFHQHNYDVPPAQSTKTSLDK